MKRTAALLGSLTIVSIFAFRHDDSPAPVSEPVQRAAAVVVDDDTTPLPLRSVEPEPRVSRSQRDLFAYEAKPVIVATPRTETPVVATVVAPQPAVEVAAPVPTAPPFPYRYIGRFGPRHAPIAAFVGNDRIVTVRPGEKIDEQFVLRAIGLESVEVEARGWDRRIPVGLSAPI